MLINRTENRVDPVERKRERAKKRPDGSFADAVELAMDIDIVEVASAIDPEEKQKKREGQQEQAQNEHPPQQESKNDPAKSAEKQSSLDIKA